MLFGIIALILAGIFITVVLYLKYQDWKNKIAEKKRQRNARKVVSAELKALEKQCTNRASLDELDRLANEDVTHVMAAMDSSGNIIGDVELIKDKEHDAKVHAIHNRTGESVIVIED